MPIETLSSPNTPPSTIGHTGPVPEVMNGYLVQLMRYNFSRPEFIVSPSLKQLIWQPDTTTEVKSKILIENNTRFKVKDAMQRPGIIIRRGDLEPQRVIIGDQTQSNPLIGNTADATQHATLGNTEVIFQMNGSYQIFCVATNGATAEDLGSEVLHKLIAWTPKIKDEVRADFRPVKLSALGKLEEASEVFSAVISIQYSYTQSMVLRAEAPLLKGFIFRADATAGHI